MKGISGGMSISVSYTHLDVYKRQAMKRTELRLCFFACLFTLHLPEHNITWRRSPNQFFGRLHLVRAFGDGCVGAAKTITGSMSTIRHA